MTVDFIAWHDATPDEQQTKTDTNFNLGYRFVSLSIYGTTSAPLYASVMVRRPVLVAQHAQWGLDATDFQSTFDSWAAKGYGPVIISATGPANSPLFAAVWQEMSPIPLTRSGLTAADFATLNQSQRFDAKGNLLSTTTIPISFDVYGDPGDRRYAVVYGPNPGSVAWNADGIDETFDEYQTRFNAQDSNRNRPAFVSPTGDGNYASIFRDDQIGPWVAHHGMSSAGYQETFNQLVAEGYFPLQVQGGGSGDSVVFAAFFTQTEQITPRNFTVTGLPASTANDPFDAAMEATMRASGVRQASLALVKGTQLVLARAYTYAEPGYPIAQPTTAFRQASCSKVITAILIFQLISEGSLSLTDTLESILDIKQPNGSAPHDSRFSQITVQHLLDHAAGIPGSDGLDPQIVAQFAGAQLPMTSAQVASWAAAQTLVGTPGTFAAWAYSNLGYSLLAQIVAAKRGTTFAQAVATHISAPLGLEHTRVAATLLADQPSDEAVYTSITMPLVQSNMSPDRPLVPWEYGDRNLNVYAGAGGMSSATVDMARVLAALNLATNNPLMSSSEIQALFQGATATLTDTQGQAQGLRADGWDGCSAEQPSGWSAQKGGLLFNAQSCLHFDSNGISMSVAWAHWAVNGDWYPNFPEVINAAATHDWGTTDLFLSFGMTALDAPPPPPAREPIVHPGLPSPQTGQKLTIDRS